MPASTSTPCATPTRGGLAATLNEIAAAARVGIEIDELAVPVADAVRSACALMGLDPLQVANEGRLVAVVPAGSAVAALDALRLTPGGEQAVVIGRVVDDHHGMVVGLTLVGGTRIIDMPLGRAPPPHLLTVRQTRMSADGGGQTRGGLRACPVDRLGQPDTEVEALALDAHNPQLGWQGTDHSGQFYRVGEAEQVAAAESRSLIVELAEPLPRRPRGWTLMAGRSAHSR